MVGYFALVCFDGISLGSDWYESDDWYDGTSFMVLAECVSGDS